MNTSAAARYGRALGSSASRAASAMCFSSVPRARSWLTAPASTATEAEAEEEEGTGAGSACSEPVRETVRETQGGRDSEGDTSGRHGGIGSARDTGSHSARGSEGDTVGTQWKKARGTQVGDTVA
jgi:hypothetical protein